MINITNPWDNMPASSQRRAENDELHNLFWLTDIERRYGFYIKLSATFEFLEKISDLKGISIIKRNMQDESEYILLLHNREDWEIFYLLCQDLITIAQKYTDEEAMIRAIENRLTRWRQLLKQNQYNDFDIETQMGLFGELSCLKNIVSKTCTLSQAIVSWVGADFDKQDFLLESSIIEVKTYRTSKAPIVNISSMYQLHSDKGLLYLLTYGLTQSENGQSVKNLVEQILLEVANESFEIQELFENKLIEYGYIPEILRNDLYKFVIDKIRVYLVSDAFPKIVPSQVKNQILHVKYSIDLLRCSEFEIKLSELMQQKVLTNG